MHLPTIFATLISFASTVLAEEAKLTTTVQEALDVAVTSIDFVVTDSHGRRIPGLRAEDFEMYERGTRQPITNFSEYGLDQATAGASPRAPNKYIFYFDIASLSQPNKTATAAATRTFLRTIDPIDEIMMVSSDETAQVRLPMTRDRQAALAALEAVSRENPRASRQSDLRIAEREMNDIWSGLTGTDPSPKGLDTARELVRSVARQHIEVVDNRMRHAAASLEGVLASAGRVPGRKTLVLFSEWLPTRPGEEINQYFSSLVGRRGGSISTGLSIRNTKEVIDMLVATAKAANVVISPVNPEGRTGSSSGDAATRRVPSLAQRNAGAQPEAFQILADQTGGTSHFGLNLAGALSRISTDTISYYSAGWKTTSSSARYEGVEIRPKNAAYRIRLAGTVMARSVGQELTERTIAYHRQPAESNQMAVAAKAGTAATVANGSRIVPLEILVPIAKIKFRPDGAEMTALVSFFVCAGDRNSKSFDVHQQTQPLRLPAATVAAAKDQSITFTIDGRLAATDDAITVGVLDHESTQTGFATVSVPRN